ncbi:MAG TPA: Imm48 family immunity protein [Candidatus Polarisedimenticolia bacterium]|nr:Imm48 family immunity protein [Candidatus Polarisedimenticolia bacterium]
MTPTPIQLLEHRKQLTVCGNDLLRLCEIEFARTTEAQRQICGAFLFGMVYAYGKAHRLKPSDLHPLAISTLMDVLQYSPDQATAFSFKLVHATSLGTNNTIKAIIHRGIDGHRQMTAGDQAGLRQSLLGIFETSGQPYAVQAN